MKLDYILRLVRGMSLNRYKARVDEVHERSGKLRPLIFMDMLWCMARYGAGYTDYVLCGFETLTHRQRDTYLTRVRNKKLSEMMNDPNFSKIFNDKNEFYTHFSKFLGRGFLDLAVCTDADIAAFLVGKATIIAKPNDGECGKGIEKIDLSQFDTPAACCAYIRDPKKNFGVIEDLLVQHDTINQLYPCSVNCIRMLTLLHKGVPHLIYAVLKTGNNGNFLDNYACGGFSCHIDCEKEIISGHGHSETNLIAEKHPYTGTHFRGHPIPYLKEAIILVKKASMVVPQMKYIGWDVCITPQGPAIVEGNDYPGDFSQVHDEGRERIGILKKIRAIGIKI